LEGEVGQMRGCPLVGGSFEPLPPAGSPEAAALKNTPTGGLAVLRALDEF